MPSDVTVTRAPERKRGEKPDSTDEARRAQALLESTQGGGYCAPAAAARAARLTVYLRFDEGGAEHAHGMKLQQYIWLRQQPS